MIDFYWTKLSFGLAIFFSVTYFLYILLYYKKCVSHPLWQHSKTSTGLLLFSLFLIIFVSTGDTSDWFSYQSIVWNYEFGEGAINHMEPVYQYLIKLTNKNYLLFRFVVWGGAFLLACISFKRFEVDINVATFLIVAAFLVRFNYARATLAMANYFLGLSFLFKPIKKHKLLCIILTALFFWGAYEFHNSLLPVLFLTVFAYIPLKKRHLFILIVLLPILASYLSNHFEYIELLDNDIISSKFLSYSERETGGLNVLGIIASIFSYGSFVIPIILISFSVQKHYTSVEFPFLQLYRVMIAIFLFAASFLFMGLQSVFFVYRYLFVTFIPIATLSAHLYEKEIMSRQQISIIAITGIIFHANSFIVSLYHTF